MKTVRLVLPIVALLAAAAFAQEAARGEKPLVEVPIDRVVLFSSGVGYFEHVGEVDGDAVTRLMFKSDQINDVLKSMVVQDLGGGSVTGVSYASQEPILRALKSFAIDISGDPNFASLLNQLRGAEVVIAAPDKQTGKILSIEQQTRLVPSGDGNVVITETVLSMLTPAGLKTIPVSSIASLKLVDERLNDELNKALDLVIASHDTQRKPVDIRFSGTGRRKVRIGYIAETPVWKASYRLDLAGDKPLIQGWAIVENTSDNDWSGVGLSLVSGRPISFIMDLYTPLYVPRPVVQMELYASLRPKLYEEGFAPREEAEMLRDSGRRAGKGFAMAEPAPSMAPGAPYADGITAGDMNLGASVRPLAQAGKIGELFNFAISEPVTLARRRSAMLPIINASISAERVSIFNAGVLPKNPLNGAYVTNDTGMKLLAGPVTVFDEGMYAGDAQFDNLAPNDKRLISYAIDLNVAVDTAGRSSAKITSAGITKGVLHIRRLHEWQQTYAINNKADVARQVIVEHPFNSSRKLILPDKYEEKTPSVYRFRVSVEAGKTESLLVKEEQTVGETIAIISAAPDTLVWYSQNAEISKEVRDALSTAIAIKREIVDLETQLTQASQQLQTIKDGQERLRRNIESVGKETTLGRRYLEKLSQEEDQIEALEAKINELRTQIKAANDKLSEYVMKL